jgi:fatty-acyl-CoA synthase
MSRFVDTLLASAAACAGPDGRGMVTGGPAAPVRRTWGEVHAQARRVAAALVEGGLRRGDAVAVLAADPAAIAPTVQAVWLAGGSITMLHQPTARTDLAVWAEDTIAVLAMIQARLVLLGAPFEPLADVLVGHGIAFRRISELARHGDGRELDTPIATGEGDTALLQLTSGSTASPKAVRITHGNLFANMTSMARTAELNTGYDVMVSWLPLFHDMGMVGFLTVPMALGLELVKVTPPEFLSRPTLWAELITRYRGTVTAAPNFAYAMAARRLAGVEDDDAYDLSTLRIALNGSEPIDPDAVRRFTDAGARFGIKPSAMLCAYGMAETTLAVSFAPLGVGMEVDEIDAEQLEAQRRAVPPRGGATRAFPLLGKPLPGLAIRVVDEADAPLPARGVGRLQLRGEAVTPGYLTVEGPRPAQDAGGWLDTGDEGYLTEDGQVVVCDRRKDVIIMGGRNIYPTDIERAGVHSGRCACRQRGRDPAGCRPAQGVIRGRRRVEARRRRRGRTRHPQAGRRQGLRRRRRPAAPGAGAVAWKATQDPVRQAASRRRRGAADPPSALVHSPQFAILCAGPQAATAAGVSMTLCLESQLATPVDLRQRRISCGYVRCQLAVRANEPRNNHRADHPRSASAFSGSGSGPAAGRAPAEFRPRPRRGRPARAAPAARRG